jgi:hypothetical protein
MEIKMPFIRIAGLCFPAFVSAVLAGCMHVPATTLYKLWSFDMATADPSILRVATRVPSYLSARPNGIKLTFTAWRDGEKDKHVHTFILTEVKETAELARLAL